MSETRKKPGFFETILNGIGEALEAESNRKKQIREHLDALAALGWKAPECTRAHLDEACPTGLRGWESVIDTPFGVSSSDCKRCAKCGQLHLKEA